jgi:hypothetical protein
MKTIKNKAFNKRAVVSVSLFIMFILLPVSGKMITTMKHDAEVMNIWADIHHLTGMLFAIIGVFHIVYNWKSLKNYLTKK